MRDDFSPLYRRLPHGPSGMERSEVRRNQRARLHGAMIEAVWRNGYERTTVAHVIALAGVSRRAFYELFANKEDCFLGTHDLVLGQARRRMLGAWRSEPVWGEGMRASCTAVLGGVAGAPKGPRLALLEAPRAGPRARERVRRADLAFERAVGCALRAAPDGDRYAPLTPRAVVAGVRHLAAASMLAGRHRELHALSEEVVDWIEGYRLPPGTRLRLARPATEPAAPPVAFLARGDARSRAMGALVCLALQGGRAAPGDAPVAQLAGLSTGAFHRHFTGREACLRAVLEELAADAVEPVRPAIAAAASWEQAVCAGVPAFLARMAARRALLPIVFAAPFELGPASAALAARPAAVLLELLCEGAPAPLRGPAVTRQALTGALWGILSGPVAGGRPWLLPALAEHLAFVVLAPHVGGRAAVRALRSSRGRGRAA